MQLEYGWLCNADTLVIIEFTSFSRLFDERRAPSEQRSRGNRPLPLSLMVAGALTAYSCATTEGYNDVRCILVPLDSIHEVEEGSAKTVKRRRKWLHLNVVVWPKLVILLRYVFWVISPQLKRRTMKGTRL